MYIMLIQAENKSCYILAPVVSLLHLNFDWAGLLPDSAVAGVSIAEPIADLPQFRIDCVSVLASLFCKEKHFAQPGTISLTQ